MHQRGAGRLRTRRSAPREIALGTRSERLAIGKTRNFPGTRWRSASFE